MGVVHDTTYDPQRSLFPVKRCSPVGCTEQTWKVRFGVPGTATDLNHQVTTYDYDAFGRQMRVTNPDGSSTATRYLDEGGFRRLRETGKP